MDATPIIAITCSCLTLISTSIFIVYIVCKTCITDLRILQRACCCLQNTKAQRQIERLDEFLRATGGGEKQFFNMRTRLQFMFALSILGNTFFFLSGIFYVIYLAPTLPNPHINGYCQTDAVMIQFTNWLVVMYNVMIAIWVFIWIVYVDYIVVN